MPGFAVVIEPIDEYCSTNEAELFHSNYNSQFYLIQFYIIIVIHL